jgi:hypothetical protein
VLPGVRLLHERIIQRSRLMFWHVTVPTFDATVSKHNEVRTYTLPGNCSRRRNENQKQCASN